jgi:hypothetical protein
VLVFQKDEIIVVDRHDAPEVPNKLPSEYFEDDFKVFSDLVQNRRFSKHKDACWDTYIGVSDGTEIPHTLLLGPWTEESTRHLFWMVKFGGAELEWVTSAIGEVSSATKARIWSNTYNVQVALLGLKNAIMAGDLRVIHLLEWAGLYGKPDVEFLIWAAHNAGGDKVTIMKRLLHGNFSDTEVIKFYSAMDQLRSKAERESDTLTLDLIKHMEASPALRWERRFKEPTSK